MLSKKGFTIATYTYYDQTTMNATDLTNALLTTNSRIAIDSNSIEVKYGTANTYDAQYNATPLSSLSFYTAGATDTVGIGNGLLLTNGKANIQESNTSGGSSTSLTPAGNYTLTDTDISNTVTSAFGGTHNITDATSLAFNFVSTDLFVDGITLDLVFGSEEYPEYSSSPFVDIAAVYLNGKNITLFNEETSQPLGVTSNNLTMGVFQDNDGNQALPIEYDGLSNRLNLYAPIQPGTNSLKIVIADTGDQILDSGLYVANLSGTQLQGNGVSVIKSGTEAGDYLTGIAYYETFDAKGGNDYIDPGTGHDVVLAGAGDDTIIGGQGINQIDGGEGTDKVEYKLNFRDSHVKIMDNDTIQVGKTNSDSLLNVETIAFYDIAFDAKKLLIEDDVAKLYVAYFGRAADPEGMKYWTNKVQTEVANGRDYEESLFEVTSAYANSAEAEKIYPGINTGSLNTNEISNFVTNVYKNLFNREPDQAGLDYWVNTGVALQAQNITLGTMVKTIIDGAQDHIGVLDRTYMQNQAQVAWNYAKQYEIKEKGWDGALLYNEANNILNTITADTNSVTQAYEDIFAIIA